MKKVLSFVCAMAVAASCTATAFAAERTATPGEILNRDDTIAEAEAINSGNATAADYNDLMAKLQEAVKAGNAHLSTDGEEIAKAAAAAIRIDMAGVNGTYQNYQKDFTAAPAENEPAVEQPAASEPTVEAAPAESEATPEEPAEAPAESEAAPEEPAEAPAENEAAPEESAEAPAESEAAPAEETAEQDSSEEEVAMQAAEEAAPVAVSEETEEEPAAEAPAESEAAPAEEAPAESEEPAEVPAEQPAEAPAESVAAPVEAAAEQVAVQDEAATQPVEVAKKFGTVTFETRSTNTLDFSGMTGSVKGEGNTYTLEANNVPEGEEIPYIVTVYGLAKYDDYKVIHNVAGTPQLKVFDVQTNALDSSLRDVSFVALGFSSYTIEGVNAPKSSSGHSHSSSSYEAPDDSIYYTCPKCGYHNWTATTGGYRCDHCGYLEEVKELAGWPNVNGVADKSAAAASVYAGAIKATGASMSVVALFALAMAGAVVGGAAYLVRKNGLGE